MSSRLASGGTAVYVIERLPGRIDIWRTVEVSRTMPGREPTMEEAAEARTGLRGRGYHQST